MRRLTERSLRPDPWTPRHPRQNWTGFDTRLAQSRGPVVGRAEPEMRHGRKTKSKRFNSCKRHLAIDLDTVLVLAVAGAARQSS